MTMIADRARFDIAATATPRFRSAPGLNEKLVRKISEQKNEPAWMLEKRLLGLRLYQETSLPNWGPDLSGLDLEGISYFVEPNAKEEKSWDAVPPEIRAAFERIGLPQAERNIFAGVGAQFDSSIIYHRLKERFRAKGVIFENMDAAVREYSDLVKKYFMTSCVPVNDHKFAMLHAAVWSGGTFIYVPPGVKVEIPLQAYFRMNSPHGGQFEHTLIIADRGSDLHYIEGCSAPRYASSSLHAGCVEIFVMEGARVRYSSIENWSKNTYNLNTKRALVDKNATIEWLNGNLGSGTTMLYPCSVLRGEGARSESLGIAFAGPGQNQDTGTKVIHTAPRTSSTTTSKSIAVGGGVTTYRGLVRVGRKADEVKATVVCDALMLDNESVAQTYPSIKVENQTAEVAHEARVGKIGDEEIFYLMSRGLKEDAATRMIVSGFVETVTKSLPLEYAVELNKLIDLEMERSVA